MYNDLFGEDTYKIFRAVIYVVMGNPALKLNIQNDRK